MVQLLHRAEHPVGVAREPRVRLEAVHDSPLARGIADHSQVVQKHGVFCGILCLTRTGNDKAYSKLLCQIELAQCDLDHQLLQLRPEIAQFDDALGAYLDSPGGRFDVWYAERRRPPLQES